MKISILCSDLTHPVVPYLRRWMSNHARTHEVALVQTKAELSGGDLLFLISCSEIVSSNDRAAYRHCLVLHASDLPRGRGWSPHIWEILASGTHIVLSLIEAEDKVDTGRIWSQLRVDIPHHALWDEINHRLFEAELQLMDVAVREHGVLQPRPQSADTQPTYCRRRTPADSEIDPQKSIAEQFNLVRVCDPQRFPAFFELHGHRYKLVLEKMHDASHGN